MTTTAAAVEWRSSLEEALVDARADTPVLLDFFSPTWGGCKRLEAVTYQDPAVVGLINTQTSPVHVNAKAQESAEVVARYLQVWTPTVFLLSPAGISCHEWNGYLPPPMYLSELRLGLAKVQLRQRRFEEAAERFEELRDNDPDSHVAPEAAYWAAVSRYNESGQSEGLMAGWEKLRQRYPDSLWRFKQMFYE